MIISNGANKPLNAQTGSVPDVSGAMLDWFQPMVFGVVSKVVEGFQAVETMVNVNFQGTWQPFTERQLLLKPEGQRAWSWFWLHAEPGLVLDTDQVVTYLGKQFRVMAHKDFRLYGYIEYHLVEDFTGSGPEVAP